MVDKRGVGVVDIRLWAELHGTVFTLFSLVFAGFHWFVLYAVGHVCAMKIILRFYLVKIVTKMMVWVFNY